MCDQRCVLDLSVIHLTEAIPHCLSTSACFLYIRVGEYGMARFKYKHKEPGLDYALLDTALKKHFLSDLSFSHSLRWKLVPLGFGQIGHSARELLLQTHLNSRGQGALKHRIGT